MIPASPLPMNFVHLEQTEEREEKKKEEGKKEKFEYKIFQIQLLISVFFFLVYIYITYICIYIFFLLKISSRGISRKFHCIKISTLIFFL